MTTSERREALQRVLRDHGLAGAHVSRLVNVRYLTGFSGSNGAAWVPADGEAVLITDGRYRDQAAAEAPDVETVVMRDLLGASAARMTPGRWGFESHALSVDEHDLLLEQVGPGVELVSLGQAVEALREVKDEAELDSLRQACAISSEALRGLLGGELVGRTERDIARDLEQRMFLLGAEAIAFDTIVAAGENAAIPHHQPTNRPLASGDLLKIDFGARVDGYHADCTRTVVLGRAADWQREIYEVVRQSQAAGLDALVEGASGAAVWQAAVGVLDAAGWRHAFTTGLGHGVGLEIHEDPYPGHRHTGRLSSRTAVTMEPGIYLPGRGGVRIEDTVIVRQGPPEVLTTMTKDLLEIG